MICSRLAREASAGMEWWTIQVEIPDGYYNHDVILQADSVRVENEPRRYAVIESGGVVMRLEWDYVTGLTVKKGLPGI